MKKIIPILIIAILLTFTACGKEVTEEKKTVNIGGLKGPTSIGMLKLLDDEKYQLTMGAAADEITPKFLQGELDIISVPANLASVLYSKTNGNIETIAVNTLGVIYIVENGGNEINSIADLKGKTIYATGKDTTPEYALTYLLSENGLSTDDVNIIWKSEPTEVVSQMAIEEHSIAMLPQPFVTVAETKLPNLRIAVDMTKAWDELDNGSKFITSVIITRKDFANENPDVVEAFLEDYEISVNYMNENLEEAGALCEQYDIVKSAIAKKAIPYCNMVCITGDDMKTALEGYLIILYDENKTAVGEKLPLEDFYG